MIRRYIAYKFYFLYYFNQKFKNVEHYILKHFIILCSSEIGAVTFKEMTAYDAYKNYLLYYLLQ